MAFHVRDPATATILEAVEHEYQRACATIPLIERLKPIQEELRRQSGPNGLPADKAFFDELSGDF
jgi:hypothetical protein